MATVNDVGEPSGRAPGGVFLSLKWKALLLTSLVLLVGAGAYTAIAYVNLSDQFRIQREAARAQGSRQISTALANSLRRLEELGAMLPLTSGLQEALFKGDATLLHQRFDASWPAFQLDMDIDRASFFDLDGAALAHWGTPGQPGPRPGQVEAWVDEALSREVPVAGLDCHRVCALYAAVPMLVRGNSAGVVLLGRSIAELVVEYKLVSGDDIAFLVPALPDAVHGSNNLAEWGLRIVALTERKNSLAVLMAASSRDPAELAREPVLVAGRYFDVSDLPIQTAGNGSRSGSVDPDVRVIGISDVTGAREAINQATRQSLVIGLTGWGLSELLLIVLMWQPLSRLRRTADKLPLLATGAFSRVREEITQHARRSGLRDEMDVLDDTAVGVTHQLEALEGEVADRSRALSRRMDELSAERDFVQSLLDTAQVIILTQDQAGHVRSVNRYGEAMTGYRAADIEGRRFSGLLAADSVLPDLPEHLSQLASGHRKSLRHESMLRCRDGSVRTVTWYHSPLSGHPETDARVLSVGLDITERKEAEHRLSWLSLHDPLTGLPNRNALQQALRGIGEESQRDDWRGALVVLDLDHFKFVNDTRGHHAGDALLKMVADRLRAELVNALMVSRLGGDQFALLLEGVNAEDAAKCADQISGILAGIESPGQGKQMVTTSLGIALLPDHGTDAGDLLTKADLALYEAKEAGRGQWRLYLETDGALERIKRNVYWKSKVEEALSEDRFLLYLQPIQGIAEATVSHYEVLLRIRDSGDGVMTPASFIDAAERSGLIHQVDRRVVSKALELLAELSALGHRLHFSINLSAHALSDDELLGHLEAELDRTGVDPTRVILEITETAAVGDFAAARRLMTEIKSLGCHFALDDFGVGFSSFYYLKQLPIDFVKIDGSFITQLARSLDDQILVRALSQVAAGFGKRTIAEYVENAETLGLLREFGIDFAQGHHIGHPAPASDIFPVSVQSAGTS
jgi:diguanylate cyclase (GGDEF)-like protein/PAS domain S-box-containing protein